MTRAPHPGKGVPATPRRTVFFAALCFLLVPAVSCAVEPNLAAAVAEAADGRVYSVGLCDGEQSVSIDITPASRCHNSYSTAKLFTAAAVGLLVDRAELSIDEPIYPILAPYFPETFDPRWKEVTVEHLLTHFVGFGEDFRDIDIDSEDPRSWGTDDYLGRAVSNDLVYPPGEKEVHSDAAFYLLSRVVAVRAGKGLDDFLRDEFFVPMRFAEYAFSRCPHGYALGATGIYLSAEDMAKFGAMYAAGGVYRGRRRLSGPALPLGRIRPPIDPAALRPLPDRGRRLPVPKGGNERPGDLYQHPHRPGRRHPVVRREYRRHRENSLRTRSVRITCPAGRYLRARVLISRRKSTPTSSAAAASRTAAHFKKAASIAAPISTAAAASIFARSPGIAAAR